MATGSARALERYAWIGGVLYVVALLAEAVISLGFKVSQDDSAAKIATSLDDHTAGWSSCSASASSTSPASSCG